MVIEKHIQLKHDIIQLFDYIRWDSISQEHDYTLIWGFHVYGEHSWPLYT